MYYVISYHGHYEKWTEQDVFPVIYEASNSSYTVIIPGIDLSTFKEGSKIDFHIKAIVGFYYMYYGGDMLPIMNRFYTVEQGDWSNTQTITISEGLISTSPNPTPTSTQNPTPTVPEFSSWTILLLALIIISTGLLVYSRKYHKE